MATGTQGFTNVGTRKGEGSTNVGSSIPANDAGTTAGGYGGSGGSGSSDPTDEQKKAAENLGGIVGYNRDTILGSADQSGSIYDISDQQNANLRAVQTTQNKRNAGNDWYTQQQKLQSTVSALTDYLGNGAYGSSLYDLWDLTARKNDQDAVATLNQMRENQNTIDNNYFESLFSSNNGRNEQAMNTEAKLRELAADYVAQTNNIHPDLAKDMIDSGNHDLNIPDWLSTSYFNDNVRQAIDVEDQGLYRPANSVSATGQKNNSQSANQSYWDRMSAGYNRRTQ